MTRFAWWIPVLLGACATTETTVPEDELQALRAENAALRHEMTQLRGEGVAAHRTPAETVLGAPPSAGSTPRSSQGSDVVVVSENPESVLTHEGLDTPDPDVTRVQVTRTVELRRVSDVSSHTATMTTDFARFAGGGLLPVKAWLRLSLTYEKGAADSESVTMEFISRRTAGRYAGRKTVTFHVDGRPLECEVLDYRAKRVPVRQGRKRVFSKDETLYINVPMPSVREIAEGRKVKFENLSFSGGQHGLFVAVAEFAARLPE